MHGDQVTPSSPMFFIGALVAPVLGRRSASFRITAAGRWASHIVRQATHVVIADLRNDTFFLHRTHGSARLACQRGSATLPLAIAGSILLFID